MIQEAATYKHCIARFQVLKIKLVMRLLWRNLPAVTTNKQFDGIMKSNLANNWFPSFGHELTFVVVFPK